MVVVQLVERSILTPLVRSSYPVIGKKLYCMFTDKCIGKTKIKKKRPGSATFKNEPGNTILTFLVISVNKNGLV